MSLIYIYALLDVIISLGFFKIYINMTSSKLDYIYKRHCANMHIAIIYEIMVDNGGRIRMSLFVIFA